MKRERLSTQIAFPPKQWNENVPATMLITPHKIVSTYGNISQSNEDYSNIHSLRDENMVFTILVLVMINQKEFCSQSFVTLGLPAGFQSDSTHHFNE